MRCHLNKHMHGAASTLISALVFLFSQREGNDVIFCTILYLIGSFFVWLQNDSLNYIYFSITHHLMYFLLCIFVRMNRHQGCVLLGIFSQFNAGKVKLRLHWRKMLHFRSVLACGQRLPGKNLVSIWINLDKATRHFSLHRQNSSKLGPEEYAAVETCGPPYPQGNLFKIQWTFICPEKISARIHVTRWTGSQWSWQLECEPKEKWHSSCRSSTEPKQCRIRCPGNQDLAGGVPSFKNLSQNCFFSGFSPVQDFFHVPHPPQNGSRCLGVGKLTLPPGFATPDAEIKFWNFSHLLTKMRRSQHDATKQKFSSGLKFHKSPEFPDAPGESLQTERQDWCHKAQSVLFWFWFWVPPPAPGTFKWTSIPLRRPSTNILVCARPNPEWNRKPHNNPWEISTRGTRLTYYILWMASLLPQPFEVDQMENVGGETTVLPRKTKMETTKKQLAPIPGLSCQV